MLRSRPFVAGVLLLVACEPRTSNHARSTPDAAASRKTGGIPSAPDSTNPLAAAVAAADSDDSSPEDRAAEQGARAALTSYLEAAQFLAPARADVPLAAECPSPPDPTPALPARVAFVRGRLLRLDLVGSDAHGRTADARAEITRVALLHGEHAEGPWTASDSVFRDTVAFHLVGPGDDGVSGPRAWSVCGMPTLESSAHHGDSPARWLPVRADSAEAGALRRVRWADPRTTWTSLRRRADSVSRLPVGYVVEGNPEPAVPVVIPDYCPGEGCSYGEWMACRDIPVLSAPRAGARKLFDLRRTDTFTAVTGQVEIVQAGKVVFRDTFEVRDDNGPPSQAPMVFTPADTLYPLVYGAEGYGSWMIHGREGGGPWFFPDERSPGAEDPRLSVVRRRVSHWWVKARMPDGREGWFLRRELGEDFAGDSPHYESLPLRCAAP